MSQTTSITARIGAQGYRTEIITGSHTIIADEPMSAGGTDQGPTPYDLLVAALGACTAITLRMYADRKQLPLDEVVVRLRHGRNHAEDDRNCEDSPVRLDRIDLELELKGDLTDEQRARLIEITPKCPLHRTLSAGIRIVLKE
ncbi:MAG: OsmC family protein [Gemmatimonadota bacterium]